MFLRAQSGGGSLVARLRAAHSMWALIAAQRWRSRPRPQKSICLRVDCASKYSCLWSFFCLTLPFWFALYLEGGVGWLQHHGCWPVILIPSREIVSQQLQSPPVSRWTCLHSPSQCRSDVSCHCLRAFYLNPVICWSDPLPHYLDFGFQPVLGCLSGLTLPSCLTVLWASRDHFVHQKFISCVSFICSWILQLSDDEENIETQRFSNNS